ncbi:MAG TPA: translation elongation factor Ts [Actinomycetota bacterium]|nr:translation elongation factor Ts [Actinomycetota bacterium]
MEITPQMVKELRDRTGAGMMDCKRALEEADGDLERATEFLRSRGLADAAKRSARVAAEGLVEAYIHMQGSLGVLVELNCETDFVSKTDDFRRLARDVAMQIAATAPRWIAREEVPDDVIDGERKVFEEQARQEEKPEDVIPRIVDGKLEAFYRDAMLLDQPWVRDDSVTIGEMISQASAKLGEKIEVGRFARFKVGEATQS